MRKQRVVQSTFLSLLILSAVSINATTYYVATPANGGSNSNAGTQAAPFATIQHGVNQLAPGDTLLVRGGVYNEAITIWNKYGTSAAPIYINEFSGESAIIDGTGTTANAIVAIGGGSSYIRFDNFEVRNGPNAGIFLYNANNVKVRWNTVHDVGGGGIQSYTPTASAWGTNNNIVIHGNTVYHCVLDNSSRNSSGGWQQAISAWRSNQVEITGNYVYENYGEGIDYILSDNGTIKGNTVWDNFSCNIYLDNAQSTKVDSNMISCSNSNYYRDGNPAGGVVVANETYTSYGQNVADGLTVTNNIVLRCQSGFSYGDWEYNGGMHNSTVANNVFYSTNYATIWIQGGNIHTNVLVANNIFYQKYNRPYASSTNTLGVTYQYNTWYGGGDPATIISGAGDITSDPKLVNPGGGSAIDYKLQSTSPCINTGVTLLNVPADFWGTGRPRGLGYDMGVHEY